MNFIAAPSPNFDERTLPITMIVLHYTGMETGELALARMRDPNAKVSAHYMVEENGEAYQLVGDEKRAWHAGVSSWGGIDNVNSASIGIEIVNGGHDFGLPDFPTTQIKAVMKLCQKLREAFQILPWNIVAHSDIAPGRKQDPGEKFPWAQLAQHGLGLWPEVAVGPEAAVGNEDGPDNTETTPDLRPLFSINPEQGETRGRGVSVMQSALAYLGYCVSVTGIYDQQSQDVVNAFLRRYRPQQINDNMDVHAMQVLTAITQAKQNWVAVDQSI